MCFTYIFALQDRFGEILRKATGKLSSAGQERGKNNNIKELEVLFSLLHFWRKRLHRFLEHAVKLCRNDATLENYVVHWLYRKDCFYDNLVNHFVEMFW